MMHQLPLGFRLRDSATFENFVPGGNGAALAALRQGEEPFLYLWGAEGSGKTHLLHAACREATEHGEAPAYLPLGADEPLGPEVFLGLECMALVCIDDVHAVTGREKWESALFDLYNRARDAGTRLVVTGARGPAALGVRLPDLASRLTWGATFHLQDLSDEDKLVAMRLRSRARGLELPTEVARFLLRRCPRDIVSLFELLDELDRASLVAQRRLTIPFVRAWLEDQASA